MTATPDTPTAEELQALEAGRLLFAGPCDFMIGVVQYADLPSTDHIEVAFAGRSNVGKSSLINALTNRKTLARTSNTPGRTREVNFFNLGGHLRLVDLPGYGYARAGKGQIKTWTALILAYLKGRPNLRRASLLIDARHGIKNSDEEIMALMDVSAVSYQLILTKCDKLPKHALEEREAGMIAIGAKHPACFPQIVRTSAETGQGIPELRAILASLATPD